MNLISQDAVISLCKENGDWMEAAIKQKEEINAHSVLFL